MFDFFKKKAKIDSNIKEVEHSPIAPKLETNTILLHQSDNCFERAEKMMKSTGIIDRMGLSNHMAVTVQNYMSLDKAFYEYELSTKNKKKK